MKALISSGASSEPRKSIIQETEHISFNDDDKDYNHDQHPRHQPTSLLEILWVSHCHGNLNKKEIML